MARPVKGRSRSTASRSPAKLHAAPDAAPATSPEALEQVSGLLAAPPEANIASRFAAAAQETPGGALALIDALGASRDEAAGRVLGEIALAGSDKEERKAARRALHR